MIKKTRQFTPYRAVNARLGAGLKNWTEALLNFGLRAIFSMIAIHLINSWLQGQGWQWSVGINPVSFLTTGFLGAPGVALLYGLRIYFGL